MTVSGAEFMVSALTVVRDGAADDRDIFLFVFKSSDAEEERESEGAGSGAGLTTLIYHGVKMRMTAIKAKAKRVLRSIYL